MINYMKYNRIYIIVLLLIWMISPSWTQTDSDTDVAEEGDVVAEDVYSLAVVPLIFYEPTITSVVARDVLNNLKPTIPQKIQAKIIAGSSAPSENLSELYDYYFLALDFDFVVLVEVRSIDSANNTTSSSDDTANLVTYQLGIWILTRGYTNPIYIEVFTVDVLEEINQVATLSTLKLDDIVQDIEELIATMIDALTLVLEKPDITLIVNKDSKIRPAYLIRIVGKDDIYPDRNSSIVMLAQGTSSIDIYQIIKGQEQYIDTYPMSDAKQKYYTLDVPFITSTSVQSLSSSASQLFGGQLPIYSNKPNIFLGGMAFLSRYRYYIVKNVDSIVAPYIGVGFLITYAQSQVADEARQTQALQLGLHASAGASFIVRELNQFTIGGSVGALASGSPKGYADSIQNTAVLSTVSVDFGYTRYLGISDSVKLQFILDISLLFAATSISATPSENDVVLDNISKEEELVLYIAGYGFLGIGFRF